MTITDEGRLKIDSLDVNLMLDDMFTVCRTRAQINWLREQLVEHVENIADEYLELMDI